MKRSELEKVVVVGGLTLNSVSECLMRSAMCSFYAEENLMMMRKRHIKTHIGGVDYIEEEDEDGRKKKDTILHP